MKIQQKQRIRKRKRKIWKKNPLEFMHKDVPRGYRGRILDQYKATLSLTAEQREILNGSLLGDGCIDFHRETKPENRSYYFKFGQTWAAAAYVEHMYQKFKSFVGTPPRVSLNGVIKPGFPKRYDIRFQTYRHDVFKSFYDSYYPTDADTKKRKKRVPQNIAHLLTPRALAHWYMDDGSCSKEGNRKTYKLCTQAFGYDDQILLQEALKRVFGIEVTIQKAGKYFILAVRARSRAKFKAIVMPFLLPYFHYKI